MIVVCSAHTIRINFRMTSSLDASYFIDNLGSVVRVILVLIRRALCDTRTVPSSNRHGTIYCFPISVSKIALSNRSILTLPLFLVGLKITVLRNRMLSLMAVGHYGQARPATLLVVFHLFSTAVICLLNVIGRTFFSHWRSCF